MKVFMPEIADSQPNTPEVKQDCSIGGVDEIWPALLECRQWIKNKTSLHHTDCKTNMKQELKADWLFFKEMQGDNLNPPYHFTPWHPDILKQKHSHAILIRINGENDTESDLACKQVDNLTVVTCHWVDDRILELKFNHFSAVHPSDSLKNSLQLYLPILVRQLKARREGKVMITAHLAQTLDGKIATPSGHSQWISNHENIVHSHRLRALHDGVMVGAQTFRLDNPRLTVREVIGKDPVRILIEGKSSFDPDTIQSLKNKGRLIIIGCTNLNTPKIEPIDTNITRIFLPIQNYNGQGSGIIPPAQIVSVLKSKGISSVFLEGGGYTISRFFEHDLIDLLHLHIAPIVLGSGRSNFSLPAINRIDQGQRFVMKHYNLNQEILIELQKTK